MSENLCIYHGNCADGFGAAWSVRRHAVEMNEQEKWTFYPGVYQQDPPDVTDKNVYMVDFSYRRATIEAMLKKAKSIIIIDHHKSAMEDLAPLEDIASVGMDIREPLYLNFDMERSGAMMAWNYFHPKKEAPALIRHIQDRDLWRFHLPGTREIQAAVFSYPYDFDVWDKLMTCDINKLREEGVAIERKHHKDIAELVSVCKRRLIIGGYDVPVASLPYTLSSDAGHQMGKGEPFAACYWDTPDGRVFSLRSAPNGVDVSEVAKKYGGGGHKHAAGFKIPLTQAFDMEAETAQKLAA